MDRETRLAAKVALVLAGLVLAGWVLYQLRGIVQLLVVVFLIVYLLNPIVDWLTRHRIPRGLAAILTYIGLLSFLVFLFYLAIPLLISEIRDLVPYFARYNEMVQPFLRDRLGEFIQHPVFSEVLLNLSQQIPQALQQLATQLTEVVGTLISRVVEIIIVMITTFYLLRDFENLKRGALEIWPALGRGDAARLLRLVNRNVAAYLRGNLLRCGLVGLLTGLGLALVGLPFAFFLGLLAGTFNIVLYIGPTLAAIPGLLLALTFPYPKVLLVLAVYLGVQAVDGVVLTPLLLGRAVNLLPFTVIASILVGGSLLGAIGVLIGIPVAAAAKVVLTYYRGRKLPARQVAGGMSPEGN